MPPKVEKEPFGQPIRKKEALGQPIRAARLLYRTVIVVSCIVCFFILCWSQAAHYLEKKTSVSQDFEVKEARALPQIVICPKTPFIVDLAQTNIIMYEREAFLRDATNVSIRFMGRVYTDYEFYKEKDYESWDLFTYYHGRCKVFNIDMQFGMNEYAAFIVDQDVQILFMDPGEDFYFRTVEFLNPVSITPITTSALIKIQPNVYKRLPDRKDSTCREYNVSQYNQCLIDLFLAEVGAENICSDMTSEPYFPGMEFCESYDMDTTVVEKTRDQIIAETNGTVYKSYAMHALSLYLARSFRGDAGDCFIPCTSNTYEVNSIPLLYMDEESLGGHIIYIGFSSMYDLVSSEYLIYNFGGIVAAMGGAIGLFVGMSVMQVFYWAFDWAIGLGKKKRETRNITPVAEAQGAKALKA